MAWVIVWLMVAVVYLGIGVFAWGYIIQSDELIDIFIWPAVILVLAIKRIIELIVS